MQFSSDPNEGTSALEDGIIDAVRAWLHTVQEQWQSLTAAGAATDAWATLVRGEVMPRLGAEFIATGAQAMPDPGVARGDQLLAWPPGVDGPPTVNGLLAMYPETFAGVSAAQVAFVVASPTWAARFTEYMTTTENLVVGMADTAFAEMQTALAKVGQGAGLFEKQEAVREFLSWDAEGGYVGWMKRAERIARTETATARNTAAHAAAVDVADAGVPMMKVWSCAHDERTRPAHRDADGQQRDIAEPFNVGDEPLDHPGDRVHGSAGNTIACRCTCSYVEGEDAQDTLDWLEQFRGTSLEELEEQMEREMQGLAAAGQEVKAYEWEGVLAPLGEPTGDGRVFDTDGDFRFRTFPLPLLWQETTGEGHDASRVVGTIDSGEIGEGGVTARGTIFADEERVLSLLDRGVIRPSVDLCDMVCDLMEGDSPDEDMLQVSSATVMAATLVAKPAFENVGIRLSGGDRDVDVEGLVASAGAGTLALDTYRAEAFADPALDGPTPVTVTDDGRVFGHLALWDSCHVGMPGRCVQPPHSATGYANFHQSTVRTDDGPLAVGRLTVGGGHADPRAGVRAAAEHYDQTGATWAMVRAGEDEYGIWVAGQVHPEASAAQINAGATAPLSGDWRRIGGGMELVAALSVSTPGFPIRREYTAADGASMSLVAAAQVAPDMRVGFSTRTLSEAEMDDLVVRMAPHLADFVAERAAAVSKRRDRVAAASKVFAAPAAGLRARQVMGDAAHVFSNEKEQ